MKGLKIVAFVVGGVVVLLAVALAVGLTSSVQTWAVRKAVAGQPGMSLDVGKVDAGFSSADVTDLRFAKDGMVITAKGVTAKYSAWDYITKKRINADSVNVDDLVVDLRNAKPAVKASPEKKTPFEGLLKQAQLPFDLRLATLTAKGRALLPNDQTVVFELKGNTIQTGQNGKLEWVVDFADGKSDAPLRALRSTGTAGLHIAGDGRIDSIEVDAIAAAMGPKLPPDRVKLTAKAEQPAPGGNEGYSATVSLMRGNNIEPLLKTNAQYLTASREIAGAWEISVRTEQLAALLTGLGLPEIAANGAGKFSLKPDTNAVSASGDLQGQASQLQKLSPALEAIGAVRFNTTFDGGLADNVARLEKLNLEVTGADGRKFAQISSLQKIGYGVVDKKVTLADPKAEVARIALQQLPLAWAQPMLKDMTIESGDLSLVLAVEAEADGSRIRARSQERLLVRSVTIRDAKKKALVEQVTLSTKPSVDYTTTKITAQLAELSVTMPAGDALTGNLSADVTNLATAPSIAFVAQLQAKVVAALKPYLPVETGPLTANINAEGQHSGQTLMLNKATAVVNRQGGALLADLALQQAIRADLSKSTFNVAKPNETAARVKLGEVPLAWAEPFVAKSKFAGALAGGTLDVTMRSLEDLTLNTAEPIALRGVGATMDGKAMAQGLDLTANLTATKRGQTIAYEVRRIDVKQGQTGLAGLTVAGEAKLGGKTMNVIAKGNLEADVAALMRQPMLAEFATLSRGRVAAAFDANLTDTIQATAAITAKDLVAKQDNRALGDLDVKLNANMKADGSGTFTLPVTLSSAARKSDLLINGAFGKAQNKETFLFTGKISSNNIVVDDFQPLAGLAPGGDKPKPTAGPAQTPPVSRTPGPAGPTQPTRDTAPFWKAVNGKVEVDLKRIVYGKDSVISGVRGAAVITDSKLSVDGLEGKFKENPFKLAGGLTFAANLPKPYSLSAAADVQNFDVGAFLRAANPSEKPALESLVTLSAKLNGNGGTLGDLTKNAYGRFDLSGGKGTLRALMRRGQSAEVVGGLATIAGAIGAAKGSDTTVAIAELTTFFAEIPFDNVKMQVERGADLKLKISSLEILTPVLRVTGAGGTTTGTSNTEEIPNQPIQVTLQLGAKEGIAHLLNRINVLGAKQDEKGYQLLSRTYTMGGTVAKPDADSLWKSFLAEAAKAGAAKALPGLLDMINRRE